MELFRNLSAIFALISICIAAAAGLRCWECENVHSQEDCLATGRLVLCEPTQNTCQITIRHGGWGPEPIIEKACKQLSACGSNHVQDLRRASVYARDTQCSMQPPSSVCRCCCSTDGCNQNVLYCEGAEGLLGGPQAVPVPSTYNCKLTLKRKARGGLSKAQMVCDACYRPWNQRCVMTSDLIQEDHNRMFLSLSSMTGKPCRTCGTLKAPRFGSMKCEGGATPQSECTFKCQSGYKMMGSAISKCSIFSERDYPAPRCRPPRCRPIRAPRFGTVTCTNRNAHRSRCSFTCGEGYVLKGARMVECYEDPYNDVFGSWSRPIPKCGPIECMSQTLKNGRVTCSDGRYVGSTCNFECNTERGYVVYPPTSIANTCQRNANWTRPPPCCSLPCPPFAVMDFVVILDSSSSVGADNWVKMKRFVRLFLSDFSVREDATNFAVVRYNRVIDMDTQILLNDHPNSLEDVLEAFDRIPYDGSGTRTGAAISYAASTLLRIGNRPFARDVVLLITDGVSNDDVIKPSDQLHATGALVFVLPIVPPGGRIDLKEIDSIARNDNNVLRDALEGGFDALDEAFARRISDRLCGSPCDNIA